MNGSSTSDIYCLMQSNSLINKAGIPPTLVCYIRNLYNRSIFNIKEIKYIIIWFFVS